MIKVIKKNQYLSQCLLEILLAVLLILRPAIAESAGYENKKWSFFLCNNTKTNQEDFGKSLDVVLDLDGTLVYTSPFFCEKSVQVRKLQYGLGYGVIEFLAALQDQPGIRMSFFSAGAAWRNKELVNQIKTIVKQETGRKLQYSLFSSEDLNYARKDLRRVRPNINLKNAVLIDDHDTSADGQKENLILIPENNAQNCKSSSKNCDPNQLVRVLGLILYSQKKLEMGTPVSTCIAEFMNSKESYHNSYHDMILKLGLTQFKVVNPSFELR